MHVVVLVDSLQIGGHSSSLMTFLQRLRREAQSLDLEPLASRAWVPWEARCRRASGSA